MELFRRLSARHPDVAEGHYALRQRGAACRQFRGCRHGRPQTAVAKAPYWKPAKMLLARTRIANGKEEEGLAIARDLVTEPGFRHRHHLEYALLLAATGRDEEARAMLTPYATGKTVMPGAVRTLGAMDLDAGNLDAATAQFENLLATGAQSYEALYFLGVIAERRKDTERALRYYSRVAGGDYSLAGAAARGAHQGRAVRHRRRPRAPRRTRPHAAAAGARRRMRRRPACWSTAATTSVPRRSSTKALARYPDALDLRMNRVFFLERTGKEDAAIRDLRALLAERPGRRARAERARLHAGRPRQATSPRRGS